jgi:AAA domain
VTATEFGHSRAWLLDAADLLAEPDPGPTPWLVDGLIVDRALIACVGRWKTTKSYALLHLCIAIATGRPAFGAFDVATPGPVVFANEESGRAALWRRLDALARGSAIEPEQLRDRLMVATNARIRLDDPGWQDELVSMGQDLQPRLFALDPLARMKASDRDENEQRAMAGVIEFIRHLREETDAAVAFVHQTGHAGGHMRGSSDLESVWETRLTWSRDGQAPTVTLASEHREAEAGPPITYRIGWDGATRSMRFDFVADRVPDLAERIIEHLREYGPGTTDDVRRGVGVRKSDVLRTLEMLEAAGTVDCGPSGKVDALGRPVRDKVWRLVEEAQMWLVPTPSAGDTPGTATVAGPVGRTNREQPPPEMPLDPACKPGSWPVPTSGNSHVDPPTGHRGSVGGPVPLRDGTHGTATGRATGDPMYPVLLAEAARDGHITEDEIAEAYQRHKLIERVIEARL